MICSRRFRIEGRSFEMSTAPQRVAWGLKAGEPGETEDRSVMIRLKMGWVVLSGSNQRDQAVN